MLVPQIGPPLGLLYLAGYARQQGEDVSRWKVVDLNVECFPPGPEGPKGHWTHDFSLDRCMAEIPTGAKVYGISLASMQMPHGVAIAEALRKRDPEALLVAGGSHASAMPEEVAEWFDVVVTQEGEITFLEVVRSSLAGSGLTDGREVGPGVVLAGKRVEPLDALPFPARDLLDFSRYKRKIAGQAATNIITTRGCPARCNFCQQESLWGSGLRMQSAERILAEVDHIFETTGIRNLLFLDDSLTARKRSDMVALCNGLRERGVEWRGWTRANLIARPGEEEVLRLMAQSGCKALCVGVEAGSDRVLKAMDKGTTVQQNETALRRIAEAGMDARCSIMVGNPTETWEDVEALVGFVARMRPWVSDWILSSYVPLPGTPSWDHPEKFGIVIDKAKAKRDRYAHFFVVGGEEKSPYVHRYVDGTGPEEIALRHDYVQESLLRQAPRDRVRVTIGAR
jgi:radical SAM superfamily enzyme YgiQ (UPF0313 family)